MNKKTNDPKNTRETCFERLPSRSVGFLMAYRPRWAGPTTVAAEEGIGGRDCGRGWCASGHRTLPLFFEIDTGVNHDL